MRDPRRVQLTRANGRTIVPAGAMRVDRATCWRPPFWLDHPYIEWRLKWYQLLPSRLNRYFILTKAYAEWLDGVLQPDTPLFEVFWSRFFDKPPPAPPLAAAVERLRGRDLADWPEIGSPCIGDLLLARANRRPDGTSYPTPSDRFRPEARTLTANELENAQRSRNFTLSKASR